MKYIINWEKHEEAKYIADSLGNGIFFAAELLTYCMKVGITFLLFYSFIVSITNYLVTNFYILPK